MRDQFPGYYRLSDAELEKLWQECLFVLDANVLLNLYRYPKDARDDLLNALDRVKDRIWLPFHAALEYQRNRPVVIAGQKSRYSEVRKEIANSIQSLETSLENLDVRKRHNNIDPDELINKLKPIFDEYTQKLDELEQEQFDVHQEDPIRIKIDSVFHKHVGKGPTDKDVEKIVTEAGKRYQNKVPPGYLDQPKDGSSDSHFTYGGVTYPNSVGDLIVWKQIIQHARTAKVKSLVFLTDDEKEDWWWNISSGGKRSMGPRPELVEEISREAGVEKFHMYTSERFLKFAERFLAAKIRENSIDDVRELKSKPKLWNFVQRGPVRTTTRQAVTKYLMNQGGFNEVHYGQTWPPLLAFGDSDEKPVGVDICSGPTVDTSTSLTGALFHGLSLKDRTFQGQDRKTSGEISQFKLFWVWPDKNTAEIASNVAPMVLKEWAKGVELYVGYLKNEEDKAEFTLLKSFGVN